jgi:NAD-dependent DNA ligase
MLCHSGACCPYNHYLLRPPLLQLTQNTALPLPSLVSLVHTGQECARYLETFKSYENKPATAIQERGDTDFMGRVTSTLTSIRGINRKDAYTLASHFNTMADLFEADKDQLADCPGLGPVKVQRLWEAFHQPFRKTIVAGMQEQQPAAAAGPSSQPGAAGVAAAGQGRPLGAGPSTGMNPTQQQQAVAAAAAGQQTQQAGGAAGGSRDGLPVAPVASNLGRQVAAAGQQPAGMVTSGMPAGESAGIEQEQLLQQHEADDDWERWEDGAEQTAGDVGQVAAGEAEQALLLQYTLAMPMEDAEYDSGEDYEEF